MHAYDALTLCEEMELNYFLHCLVHPLLPHEWPQLLRGTNACLHAQLAGQTEAAVHNARSGADSG